MPKKFKWEIKELSAGNSLKESARLILQQRLKTLNSAIKIFFEEETVDNLHQVRIALRRLRYNMEIFISCFNKTKFINFYELVEHLQDLTGSKRDLDVLTDSIKIICNGEMDSKINSVLEKIGEKNKELTASLILELMKFTHSRELKEFTKMIILRRKSL
ncbi:MAG: CHAD domain-containing protein [Ignavibacteriaceae bacterium]